MSLNDVQVATLASKRLKMDGRSILPLQTFINNALNNLARECANDDYKRRYLMTVPVTTTATITNDSGFRYYADLATLLNSPQIMLDYLQYGTIYYVPASQTFLANAISGNRISIPNNNFQTGLAVQVSTTNTLPSPLVANTTYYIIRVSATLISFASTLANAVAGTPIALTDPTDAAGTGTITPFQEYITQWLASPTQAGLISSNPFFYPYIWLVNNYLYTDQISGSFRMTVPFIPTLDNLPEALESDLVDAIVQIAITQGFEPKNPAVN
jgi:hypothetical protein